MLLNTLFQNAGLISSPLPFPFGDTVIRDIKADSRRVERFDVFVSIPGPTAEDFLRDALCRGCRVVVVPSELADHPLFQEYDALAIPNENPRLALAKLAAVFYGQGPDTVVAVTGTNGKSSTVHYVRQFMEAAHIPAASIGTLGLVLGATTCKPKTFADILNGASLTTLDSLRLHQLMHRLHENGINHMSCEASSHGLDQYRLHGVTLTAAAFTNLTQDHLDYHQTIEAYFQAKAKVFTEVLPAGGTAVLNKDIEQFKELEQLCRDRGHKILTFSRKGTADLMAMNVRVSGQSQQFDLNALGKIYKDIHVNMSGDFQIENLLAALGLVLASGLTIEKCVSTFSMLTTAAGRLERVAVHNDVPVYVDYAHTPDALLKALENLRPYTANQLWVVFGCGGNRDVTKRPLMGNIAFHHADHCIITDDNPRFEDPQSIRDQIKDGMTNSDGQSSTAIIYDLSNRSEAIAFALKNAKPGDTILIAGKGHERGQLIGNTIFPFDDKEEVLSLIQKGV